MAKLALVDLDGVLNTYSGNYNAEIIDPPREGAKEFLENLSKLYTINIFTVRNKKMVVKWLEENNLINFVDDVTDVKNKYTSLIIDDRAIRFDGDYEKALALATDYKPHWKN